MQVNPFDRAIISDASCLITLTNINRLIILSQLYKEIIINPEVASEYRHSLPEWVIVQDAKNKVLVEKIHEKILDWVSQAQ